MPIQGEAGQEKNIEPQRPSPIGRQRAAGSILSQKQFKKPLKTIANFLPLVFDFGLIGLWTKN
jgi:hypothetical protein